MNTAAKRTEAGRWLSRTAMLSLALLVTIPCWGQFTSGNGGMGQTGRGPARTAPVPDVDQPMTGDLGGDHVYQERRLNQLNAAQHKSMVADTDKLLKLVTELNAEISSTNPTALTAEQLKKIAEIEKLAHNVKDKMRMSVRSATDNMQIPSPIYGNPHL